MKLDRTINYNFSFGFFSVAEFQFYFATGDFRFDAVLPLYAWPTN